MSYKVDTSVIHGLGVIAETNYPTDAVIGIWFGQIGNDKRRLLYQPSNMTEKWFEIGDLGRYCNHQNSSNTIVRRVGNVVQLISMGINIGEEITTDYRMCTQITGFQIDTTGFIEL